MPNLSKIKDKRFWRKWKASDAVGGIYEAMLRTKYEELLAYETQMSSEQKEDCRNAWNSFVNKDAQHDPLKLIYESLKLMQKLSEGGAIEEVIKSIHELDVSGAQAGYIGQIVSNFHPRGDKFRECWNKIYVGEGGEEVLEALNPGIIEIDVRF